MNKPSTYLLVTIFLPTYETYFLQNWLPRWNQILIQLRFIHNWVIMGIQWMVHRLVPVPCGLASVLIKGFPTRQSAWWEALWFGRFQHEEQNKNKLPSLIDKFACIVEELDAKIIHEISFIDKKPLAYIFPTPLDHMQGILQIWASTFLVQVYILHFLEPLKTTLT
jgi:hypothetical protein